MTKTTLTRKDIHELHAACNRAAALPGVTTKMRYACIRNIRELSKVIDATSKAIPRPCVPKFDAEIVELRKSNLHGDALDAAVRAVELNHPEDVTALKDWRSKIDQHLAESEEVNVYRVSVSDVGDLVDDGSKNKGFDAGVLMNALVPMLVD